MKEENKESHLPKSNVKDKVAGTVGYLIGTLVIAIIYGTVTSTYDILLNLEIFIPWTIGALVIPAIIAGLVTWMNKGKYVKNLFWTSLGGLIITAFGQLSV
tara:strand:+ start:1301 stop:1603 length:303 start_codon:yes stop_codon:yes gene_type:complete